MYRLSATVLFLAGAFAFAQVPDHGAPAVASAQSIQAPWISAPHDPIPATGCPVGFFANRQAATKQVATIIHEDAARAIEWRIKWNLDVDPSLGPKKLHALVVEP